MSQREEMAEWGTNPWLDGGGLPGGRTVLSNRELVILEEASRPRSLKITKTAVPKIYEERDNTNIIIAYKDNMQQSSNNSRIEGLERELRIGKRLTTVEHS